MRESFSIPVTTRHTASITREEAIKLAVDLIDETCVLYFGRFITDDGLLAFNHHDPREGWEKQIVRPATEQDRAAVLIIKALTERNPSIPPSLPPSIAPATP